jgi:hypothetical protein
MPALFLNPVAKPSRAGVLKGGVPRGDVMPYETGIPFDGT